MPVCGPFPVGSGGLDCELIHKSDLASDLASEKTALTTQIAGHLLHNAER